jgi:CheY-like chemotaxis protein
MEALGGYYGVTDRLDGKRGSLFWFAFPYRPDFDAEEAFKLAEAKVAETRCIDEDSADSILARSVSQGASAFGSEVATTQSRRTVSRMTAEKPISLRGLQLTEERIAELRVLVVDDSLTILKMVSRALEQHGFTVETAKNGSIALNKLIESNLRAHASISNGDGDEDDRDDGKKCDALKRFDIVLMDLQMPVMGKSCSELWK